MVTILPKMAENHKNKVIFLQIYGILGDKSYNRNRLDTEKRMTMGEMIQFQNLMHQKRTHLDAKYDGKYECFITLERLYGYCNLLIYERERNYADWFFLKFSPEGLSRHTTIRTKHKIESWLQERTTRKITYLQAIRLLGDAVRQRYKYHKETDWIHEEQCIHLQRIWQEQFYSDAVDGLEWLLPKQECAAMLKTYFRALNNKDAVLLYDLSANQIKAAERRSMYAYSWNHVLEDMHIFDFQVDRQSISHNGNGEYALYITAYGEYIGKRMLEVDLCLRVIQEQGTFRIVQDQILESRSIYKTSSY